MKVTRQRVATALAVFLTLVVLASLIILYRPMYPILAGTSDDFWFCTVHFAPHGGSSKENGASFVKDGFAYYSPFNQNARWVYRVPADEVSKDFPLVIRELEAKIANPADTGDVAEAYRFWKADQPWDQDGANGLGRLVVEAAIARQIKEPTHFPGTAKDLLSSHVTLERQVARSHFYWANFVFEFMLLAGLIWFILWPAIRGLKSHRWLLHLGLAPFFFFLPTWLGYCAAWFEDGGGPTGGILYPHFIQLIEYHASAPNADWEIAFLKTIPKLLEPINQTSLDLDDALDYKEIFYHFTGPIEAALASLILCTLFFLAKLPGAIIALIRYLRRRQASRHAIHAFEVQPDQSHQSP